jgi:hypothetical protein
MLVTRTHTHPYEYTYANPILWAPSKDWAPTDLEILEVTTNDVSWKIQKKVRAPGFETW